MLHAIRVTGRLHDLPTSWRDGSALDSATFIITTCRGKPSKILSIAEHRCREALWVLEGSLLYFSPRSKVSAFGLRGDIGLLTAEATLICTNRTAPRQSWDHRGALIPQELDSQWSQYYKQMRLSRYFNFLGDQDLSKKWKAVLWRAATLVGRSRHTESRAEAFLYQVFALEALLLNRGDTKRTTLSKRLAGLLYGHADAHVVDWLYGIRSEVVHDGNYAAVTAQALHAADYYALNATWNAIVQSRHWKNKQEFLEYCSRRERMKRPPTAKMGLRVTSKPFYSKDYDFRLP